MSEKELKTKSMKEMKEKLKLNIGVRKRILTKFSRKISLISDDDLETIKSETIKTDFPKDSTQSICSKSDDDPERFQEKYKILKKVGEGQGFFYASPHIQVLNMT